MKTERTLRMLKLLAMLQSQAKRATTLQNGRGKPKPKSKEVQTDKERENLKLGGKEAVLLYM